MSLPKLLGTNGFHADRLIAGFVSISLLLHCLEQMCNLRGRHASARGFQLELEDTIACLLIG